MWVKVIIYFKRLIIIRFLFNNWRVNCSIFGTIILAKCRNIQMKLGAHELLSKNRSRCNEFAIFIINIFTFTRINKFTHLFLFFFHIIIKKKLFIEFLREFLISRRVLRANRYCTYIWRCIKNNLWSCEIFILSSILINTLFWFYSNIWGNHFRFRWMILRSESWSVRSITTIILFFVIIWFIVVATIKLIALRIMLHFKLKIFIHYIILLFFHDKLILF